MYDYFTSRLYFKPNSQRTKVKRGPQSRALQCNDIYTGYVDEYGNEHLEYSYTYCWDDGFGGGSDYVYEDDNDGGDEDHGDIDYEVAPPPDGGGGSSVEQEQNNKPSAIPLNNTSVKTQKASAVSKMKSDLPKGRREYGFWIFYNSKDNSIYVGNMKSGPLKTDITNASIKPDSNTPIDNGNHIPTSSTAIAFFHTHTAMSELPIGYERYVGLSDADSSFANKYGIIIMAEDYIGIKDTITGIMKIISGHQRTDSMKTYIYQPK